VGDALIRTVRADDAAAIADIYAHFVRETAITFEIESPDADAMRARIATISARYPYLVVEDDGAVIGYAYANELYARAAYRWVVESTIYLTPNQHRRGSGRRLYQALLDALRARGFQAAVGKITLPNGASVGLHEALGFAEIGRFHRVGYKQGAWHDVALYQIELADRPSRPAEPRQE